MDRVLEFDGSRFQYGWWSGQLLKGTAEAPCSVDLETCLIRNARPPLPDEDPADVPLDPLDVPVPTLGMACDHTNLYLIHPLQFAAFIRKHRSTHWVLHNAVFDWWCLHRHADSAVTREYLWQLAEAGLVHDTMIFDQLLQLATGQYRRVGGAGGEQKLYPTNLGVLSDEWGCGTLEKTDPYRLRFGEFKGLSEGEIDRHPEAEQFFAYALKDVLACHTVFQKQRVRGLELMQKAGWNPDPKTRQYEIRPDAVQKFGVLSETIQVKAAIVLVELGRTPIRIDLPKRQRMEAEARHRYQQQLIVLTERVPELIRRTKAKYKVVKEGKGKAAIKSKVLVKESEVVYTKKAGVPSFNNSVLVAVLHDEAARMNVSVPISKGKEKRVSISTKDWQRLRDRSEFIRAWCSLESEGKLIQDLCAINAPVVYSKYDLLKVTGRTGSGQYPEGRTGRLLLPSLNIQNVKRDSPLTPDDNMRPLFLAPEGHLWAAVDYGYIEFRAMAAVAQALYGHSEMRAVTVGHTLHGGPDPHQVTAASVLGLSIEDYLRLDKDVKKKSRQDAKPANFGLMGGMGAATYVEYARTAGVTLTLAESKEVKRAFKTRYPEMVEYLKGSAYQGLMWETDTKSGPRLTDQQAYRLSKFLRTTDGADPDYSPDEDRPLEWSEKGLFWSVLEWAAKRKGDAETQEDVRNRRVTQRVRRLTYYRSCTLTGRIRNYCTHTEERNHRFQASAADGAKLAMFKLMRKGYKLLNFVHDEIGLALPVGSAGRMLKEVEKIMVAEMESVLGHGVPVAVDGSMAPCWSKA